MSHKTVFVIGAGASAEANLPVGAALRAQIAQLLNVYFDAGRQRDGDPEVWEAIKLHAKRNGVNQEAYFSACRRIATGVMLAPSIDNYIDNHSDNPAIATCGKVAIAHAILAAERSSRLHNEEHGRTRLENLGDTWYSALWQLLNRRATRATLAQRLSNVAFIVFNYDRCLEQYLFHAIQHYWNCEQAAAANLMQNLRIYHPYGMVGWLPWQAAQPQAKFGGRYVGLQLLNCAAELRTFTEQVDPNGDVVKQIRVEIQSATRIIFLGFAFHDDNMDLLKPGVARDHSTPDTEYFASAYGLSDSDCIQVRRSLKQLKKEHRPVPGVEAVVDNKIKCADLFSQYAKSISF